MKIFTIKHQETDYDCYLGHTIVANTAEEVRKIAKSKSADEGREIWDTAEVIECGIYTCHRTKPFILMSDFNAG